jgi:hypothetical protein
MNALKPTKWNKCPSSYTHAIAGKSLQQQFEGEKQQ